MGRLGPGSRRHVGGTHCTRPVSYAGIAHAIARALTAIPGMGFYGSGWIEFAANIALLVPRGFLLTLLIRREWFGALLGVGISAGVEIAQILISPRQPTLRDFLFQCDRCSHRRSCRLADSAALAAHSGSGCDVEGTATTPSTSSTAL